ncbi:MAG: type II toxin-antitoxin system VapC family toxin [Opitutaceae bacterium]|jgi:predicted nucleic acid-binding protein|nr:type II toxin-antitoxin system VapC family toxin [Opitutaceae bacterium]
MSVYFDTSVWMSFYMRDAHHQEAAALATTNTGVFWTPWQRLEFFNAIRACIARKRITVSDVHTIEKAIKASIAADLLLPRPLPAYALWQEAEQLSQVHTPATGVRTLDLLHVAAARVLKADRFCTFDTRQHALARAAGLLIN